MEASFADKVQAVVRRIVPGASVSDLRQLPGGASQQTWLLELGGGAAEPGERLILRLSSGWHEGDHISIRLTCEAELLKQAAAQGVPAPAVRCVLKPEDDLGEGYFMTFVAGETQPRRILSLPGLAHARAGLARQCGVALAKTHAVSLASLDFLYIADTEVDLRRRHDEYRSYGQPQPVFELAFQWLLGHLPEPREPTLVHGDFRNGNLVVDSGGLAAVLDWELACVGDPMADLGWLCVNSWRFGHVDKPVGGFGTREDLIAGYEAAGGRPVDRAALPFWEIHGSLKWGLLCMSMAAAYQRGADRSVERAAIGRRASEAEIDILRGLEEQAQPLGFTL